MKKNCKINQPDTASGQINRLLIITLVLIIVSFATYKIARAQVKLTEKAWILPTYTTAAPDKNPIFFRNEAYQGASRHYYPLTLNNQYINERKDKAWKTLILENEYIELGITPEIGGKLYYATDKSNGYNFIYKNTVVKPGNIGMTGAWVSGGIEWCVLHHHRASTFRNVDYSTSENKDGSKTIYIGESEPRHGMRWTIAVTLRPGKSYFEVDGTIHNASPFTHTFLYWANVAAHANENYQAIFPPSVQIADYHSKTSFTRWPFSTEVYNGTDFTKGVDISWWKNVKTSNSFFAYDLKEDFMGGYDHGKNSGTVHIGDHNIVKGAKLWEWGSGPRGQATEGKLTEKDGPYVEIMVGAYSDNQPDYSWIKPYEVKKWKQYWYPIKGIKGFKNANLNGAVNLEKEGEREVFLGFCSTQNVKNARVSLKNKGKEVFGKSIAISPDKPFAEHIKIDGSFEITDLSCELINADNSEKLIRYQPVKYEPVEKLPAPVKGYPKPSELKTVEELYLTGSRVEQFYSPRENPLDWYLEALRRDSGDVRTNTAVGSYYLKQGDYAKARNYLARAIQRLTRDFTRPSAGEALYLQGLTLKGLGLIKEAVDTLYRATWDYAWHSAAYYQLAQISANQGDYLKALEQVNEALVTNARNNKAINLKASLQRKTGDFNGALETLKSIIEKDPLDFRAFNEQYLTLKAAGNLQKANPVLTSLTRNMRDFDQNYLDLAVGYIEDGFTDEPAEMLTRYKGRNPEILYYQGYLADKRGNKAEAERYFRSAAGCPVDYVFPYKLNTIAVLEKAITYNPADANAYYFIGNILYEKQPSRAIEFWEKAVKTNTKMDIAFRNLGWGYYRHGNNPDKAIGFYEKAISMNGNEPIYYTELDELYEKSNAPLEKRLNLFEGKNEVVKKRDDSFIRQIAVLTLAGRGEEAVKYLEGAYFNFSEGNSRAREVMIDAQIVAGKNFLAQKEYRKALDHFILAQLPEEEAGSSRLGSREIQVNYYTGYAYEMIGEKAKADELYKRAVQNESGNGVMAYYKGLSYIRLNDNQKAAELFRKMIEEGNRQIEGKAQSSEFGVIFGERESDNSRKSQFYTIRGLGYKGLKQNDKAENDLNKAMELSYSNLWAKAEK